MKHLVLLLVALSLLLSACQSASELPASTARQVVPLATATRAVIPDDGNALHAIDLRVGRGVDGGWFQLYFTNPADPAADQREGGPDAPLVNAIDASQLSVDAALYSLSLRSVRQALIHAQRRGVQVRVVMESDNLDGAEPQALKEAGIPLIGDRSEGLMHNKFIIIDASEVWTGSMNLTGDGAYEDRNSLIRIKSSKVAADYAAEFNEMFADDKVGDQRGRKTPNPHVTVDGTLLDIYFSPDDHVQTALLDLLQNAKSSIYFLAYSFTSDPLGMAIRTRAEAGVVVQGVMDEDQMATNTGSEYDAFRSAGVDVRLDGEPGLMHHKVIIVDGQTVVVGSYNFTASAEKRNDENLVVIHSPEIATQYMREFRRIYALAEP